MLWEKIKIKDKKYFGTTDDGDFGIEGLRFLASFMGNDLADADALIYYLQYKINKATGERRRHLPRDLSLNILIKDTVVYTTQNGVVIPKGDDLYVDLQLQLLIDKKYIINACKKNKYYVIGGLWEFRNYRDFYLISFCGNKTKNAFNSIVSTIEESLVAGFIESLKQNNRTMYQFLMALGITPNFRVNDQETKGPLATMMKENNHEVVRWLVGKKAKVLLVDLYILRTYLEKAIKENAIVAQIVVTQLVKEVLEICKDEKNCEHHKHALDTLAHALNAGAPISWFSKAAQNDLFYYAARVNIKNLVNALKAHNKTLTKEAHVIRAVKEKNKGLVQRLIAVFDADPNQIDKDKRSALYIAINQGSDDLVDQLLALNVKLTAGKNPLALAMNKNQENIVKKLLAYAQKQKDGKQFIEKTLEEMKDKISNYYKTMLEKASQ